MRSSDGFASLLAVRAGSERRATRVDDVVDDVVGVNLSFAFENACRRQGAGDLM